MATEKLLFQKNNRQNLDIFSKGCRLAALDLDHTTLLNDGSLSEETAAALSLLAGHSISIVIASGRPFAALPETVLSLPGVRYAITSNGASLCQLHPFRYLCQLFLPETAVDYLRARYLPLYPLEAFVDGQGYSPAAYVEDPCRFGAPKSSVSYVKSTRIPVENMESFLSLHRSEIQSIDIISPGAKSSKALRHELACLDIPLHITSSAGHLVELSHCSSGKEQRIADLADMLNLPLSSCLAFGDGDNDAGMLHAAGMGIAMKNASEDAKNAADYLTLSNEEHGVAAALRYIFQF